MDVDFLEEWYFSVKLNIKQDINADMLSCLERMMFQYYTVYKTGYR